MTKTLDNDANTILSFRLVFIYTRFRYTLSQSIKKKNNKKKYKKRYQQQDVFGFLWPWFFFIVVVHLSSVFVTHYMPCRSVCWFWFDYLSLFLAQVIRKRIWLRSPSLSFITMSWLWFHNRISRINKILSGEPNIETSFSFLFFTIQICWWYYFCIWQCCQLII